MTTKLASLVLSSMLLVAAAIASAQPGSTQGDRNNGDRKDAIVVNVRGAAEPDPEASGSAVKAALSRDFAASALAAAAQIRNWQVHLAYSLKNGYPLSELWITSDRDRAADALELATLAAKREADRAALVQLNTLFGNVQGWSDARVDDKRNMRLAKYYMSASALDDDKCSRAT